MMTNKQKSEYLVNSMLLEMEMESFEKWFNDVYETIPLKDIRKPRFLNELKRRVNKVNELEFLVDVFEILQTIDRKYAIDMTDTDTDPDSDNPLNETS